MVAPLLIAAAAAAPIAGAGIQAYYGNKASKKAAQAAAAAAEEMRQAKARAIGYQTPYYNSGNLGLNNLTGLLTGQQVDAQGNVSVLSPEKRMELFQTSPGYQFRLDQATNALQASQAARGGLLSGGAAKELTQYSQGIASDEYGNYISNLFGLAGIGQQAATNMGNYEIGAGSQISDFTQAEGLAQASKYTNMGNAFGGAFSQIGGLAGLAAGQGGAKTNSAPLMAGGGAGSSPSYFQQTGNSYMSPNYSLNSRY